MPVTEVQLVNMALHRLGVERISSLSDNNKRAVVMNDLYPLVRDELLESGFWNFAMKRVELVKDVTAPDFGWKASYALPSDYIRMYNISSSTSKGGFGNLPEYFPVGFNTDPDFVIEGDKLLTDLSKVYCIYASRETDPDVFSAGFRKALYLKLAAEAAYSLVQDRNLSESLTNEAQLWLEEVRSRDSMNDNDPFDQPEFESLVAPRF